MQFENNDDHHDVLDFSPKYVKSDEENDNSYWTQNLAGACSNGLGICSELLKETTGISTGQKDNQKADNSDRALDDTSSVCSFNSSFDKLSISDISSDSTDAMLVLTPKSGDIITRSDLSLLEQQGQVGLKHSVSVGSVNSKINKFSSTSVDTVVEKKNSDIKSFEIENQLERKLSTRRNFEKIDFSGMAVSSWMGPSFTKYVPIEARKGEFVPTCLHNQVDPTEWWELQSCLTRQAFGTGVHETSSDTSLQDRKKCKKIKGKKKFKKLFMCTTAQDSPLRPQRAKIPLHEEDAFCKPVRTDSLVQPKDELPGLGSTRFNQTKNANYLNVSCREDASYSAILYTPLPENPNQALCQYQSEMASTAMLAFFHPRAEVKCVWVASLRSKLAELLHEGLALRPKFARSVRMCEFKAVLVVSDDAGVLIRHRDMNFLHSVAVSLGIETKHLLVLVREGPSCLGTAV